MSFNKFRVLLLLVSLVLCLFAINCSRSAELNQGQDSSHFIGPLSSEKNFTPWDMTGSALGERCIPSSTGLSQADCQAGYICVSTTGKKSDGVCLQDCGKKEDEMLVKRLDACPKNHRCMLLKGTDLTALGMFCLRPQSHKDMKCEAPFDDLACLNNLSCVPTSKSMDEATGTVAYDKYRCKEECSVDQPCVNAKEQCLMPGYARKVRQYEGREKAAGKCTPSQCESHDPSCPCDSARGFTCDHLIPGVDMGICMRTMGVCGEPVPLASLSDFKGHNYLGETCNEINEHRLCEGSAVDSSSIAQSKCKLLSKNGEGACVARCFWPALDLNGDGKIKGKESGISLACPKGYTCGTDIAKRLHMYSVIEHNDHAKPCDPTNCQKDQPCPQECGPGDAQCLAVGSGEQLQHVCGAPVGTCMAN